MITLKLLRNINVYFNYLNKNIYIIFYMFSSRQFIPGKRVNSTRSIKYNAVYNELRESLSNNPTVPIFNYQPLEKNKNFLCICFKDKANFNDSQTCFSNTSRYSRMSQKIQSSLGGSTQYGNYYLNQPPMINYLGRVEGQPGGGGLPPRNKF